METKFMVAQAQTMLHISTPAVPDDWHAKMWVGVPPLCAAGRQGFALRLAPLAGAEGKGTKVNYARFGDLLVRATAVAGGKEEE